MLLLSVTTAEQRLLLLLLLHYFRCHCLCIFGLDRLVILQDYRWEGCLNSTTIYPTAALVRARTPSWETTQQVMVMMRHVIHMVHTINIIIMIK